MTALQLYKTADGSIWEPSTTAFSGAMAFKLISSNEGVQTGGVLSLNEVIQTYGPIGFYDPVQEERDAILQSMHASGLVTATKDTVKNFQVQLVNRGYAVMPEDQ